MEFRSQFGKLFQSEKRKWFLVVGIMAFTHILFQSLLLPYGNALRSLLPDNKFQVIDESTTFRSSTQNSVLRDPLARNLSDMDRGLEGGERRDEYSGNEAKPDSLIAVVADRDENGDSELAKGGELNEVRELDQVEDEEEDRLIPELAAETEGSVQLEQIVKPSLETLVVNYTTEEQNPHVTSNVSAESNPVVSSTLSSSQNETYLQSSVSGRSFVNSSNQRIEFQASENDSLVISKPGKRKMRCNMPPKTVTTIDDMNQILLRHRRSSRAMRPQRSSKRDEEILAARLQIENAPHATNDKELYAPIFRNVSLFRRSYELMQRMLKVYVYKEGNRPIFHTPILKGLYASEGWFMKLMESDKHYVVKDPRRAHLFYMPFSSRMLEYTLYVRNSHNRTNLRQFLKGYTGKIAAKYPYFNRTGGADHFLVACHDWAPYETRHHMEHCIKALCNADVTVGFKIGRDVSLPETYVRAAKNPLRDLGGKPPLQRKILAFYAGSMHGYLRPMLLKYWKDKEPDMKIFGPMPPGVASKMNYIQHMKSSRYCVCPKGYEVNSPRVVESIFYECVPVIISDNFVPPFFDVLDWSAFSLILAEKDIPNLREILLSIPEERYLAMQLAVRKAQRHFLWHAKPESYDLFHMTLHSIWFNRVFQIKRR